MQENKVKKFIEKKYGKEKYWELFDNAVEIAMDSKPLNRFVAEYKNYIGINWKGSVKNKDLKLYSNIESFALYPKFLGKEKAMKYLLKKLNPTFVIGAGDSDADLEFLNLSDIAIIPTKSNLMKKYSLKL